MEKSWQNIPTLSWFYLSLHTKNLKLNFNKQNLGQGFSWEHKHTSGIHKRHTHMHMISSHICTLHNQLSSVSHMMEGI